MKPTPKPKTPLEFILIALIPYSRPGLMLAYKPNLFFNELEKLSGYRSSVLRTTFARAKSRRLISLSTPHPTLSLEARLIAQPYVATLLDGGGQLMVTFDIPVGLNLQRRQLRAVLKRLNFTLVQQSLWISPLDHTDILVEYIKRLKLNDYVQLYEAARLIDISF